MRKSNIGNCFIRKVTDNQGQRPYASLVIPLQWTYFYNLDESFLTQHSKSVEGNINGYGDFAIRLSADEHRQEEASQSQPIYRPIEIVACKIYGKLIKRERLSIEKHRCSYKVKYELQTNQRIYELNSLAGSLNFNIPPFLQVGVCGEAERTERINSSKYETRILSNFNHFCKIPMISWNLQKFLFIRVQWLIDLFEESNLFPAGSNCEFLKKVVASIGTGTRMSEEVNMFSDSDCKVLREVLRKKDFKIKQFEENGRTCLVLPCPGTKVHSEYCKVIGKIEVPGELYHLKSR